MSWELKRQLLETLYKVYNSEASRFETACGIHCNACCSCNLIGTSLEANYILSMTGKDLLGTLLEIPLGGAFRNRLHRPSLTINDLALNCLGGQFEDEAPPDISSHIKCPFRSPQGCSIYECRPLACRMMWSKIPCSEGGAAHMPPELISLNGAFQQILEDVDRGGLYGNLFDLLEILSDEQTMGNYMSGAPLHARTPVCKTRSNPGLMVPPEHRQYVGRALCNLWMERPGGMIFKEAVESLGRFDATT